MMAFIADPPRIPAMAMASRVPGKEMKISAARMMIVSTMPP